MKKIIEIAFLLLTIILLVFLINDKFLKYKSCIYKIDGIKVKVTLEKSGGYTLDDKNFVINKMTKSSTTGEFLGITDYNIINNVTDNDPSVRIIDKGTINNIDYIFYYDNNRSAYSHIVKIKDSDMVILLISRNGEEDAVDIFSRLQFEMVK